MKIAGLWIGFLFVLQVPYKIERMGRMCRKDDDQPKVETKDCPDDQGSSADSNEPPERKEPPASGRLIRSDQPWFPTGRRS